MLPKVFESFDQTDDRSQMSEDRCQKTDVRRQMSEDRCQRTDNKGQEGEKISAFRNPTSYYLLPLTFGL